MRNEDLRFIKNNDNIFSIQVYIPLGSIHEPNNKRGISHFLEHIKFKRSKKFAKENDFLQEFSNITTISNAYTTKDHTSYYIRTLESNWKKVVELMNELVFNTKFNIYDIELEKKVIIEEKLSTEGDLESLSDIDIHDETSILDSKNPYSKSIIGDMNHIKKITKNDLEKYNKRYINNYLVVISCTDKIKSQVKSKCIKLFPDSINKKDKELENTKSFKYTLTIRNLNLPQNNIFINFKSFSENDPNKYYLDFIQSFIANQRTSILYKKLRKDNGFVYSVNAYNESYKDYGCFRILVSTNKTNNIINIINMIFNEISILKTKGLTDIALKKYKKQFMDKIKYYFKNNDILINKFGSYLYYDRSFTVKKYENIINNITKEKIMEIMQVLFDFNTMGFVLYGDVKNINTTKKSILKLINKNKKLLK
jgi:predicted Zn-dependent peptidase